MIYLCMFCKKTDHLLSSNYPPVFLCILKYLQEKINVVLQLFISVKVTYLFLFTLFQVPDATRPFPIKHAELSECLQKCRQEQDYGSCSLRPQKLCSKLTKTKQRLY